MNTVRLIGLICVVLSLINSTVFLFRSFYQPVTCPDFVGLLGYIASNDITLNIQRFVSIFTIVGLCILLLII